MWTALLKGSAVHSRQQGHLVCRTNEKSNIKTDEKKAIQAFAAISKNIYIHCESKMEK